MDDWSEDIGRRFFGSFHLEKIPISHSRSPDCFITLRRDDPPSIFEVMRSFKVQRGICHSDGDRLILEVDGSVIFIDSELPGNATVWFGSSDHARRPGLIENVLSYLLPAALRRCRLYEIHAAGVVEPDSGTGFLLIGESSSGKSSLTVRLAGSGWKYLSDDMVVVNATNADVEAIALRRVFSVSPSSIAPCELPRLAEALGRTVRSHPDKRRLEPSIVFPGKFIETCSPRVLCFLSIEDREESRLLPISHSAAMIRLMKHCAWSCYDESGAHTFIETLGKLVRQTRCYTLSSGRDILAQPSLSAKILGEAVCN